MKKLVLTIAVVMMAFTASFAQDRQHADQTTRNARNRDQATTRSRNTRVSNNNGYQSSHHYRSQSRRHHTVRRSHYRANPDGQ
jgi:Ni/Co efflux regulator RcnB